MAVWALLSISQTVKAADEVYLLTGENINGAGGSYNIPSNHKMELESGDTYKIKIESNSDAEFYFRVGVKNQYQLAPSTDQELLSITEEGASISAKSASKKDKDAWKVSFDKNTYEYITIHVVIKGETKVWVDGKKKDSGIVTPPIPSGENPIANRKYSEGYYLVGNFFNFDGADINYKDAVFKFQQVSADADGNAIYSVEIPATLTAKAQVMSVDATGASTAVYGPGSELPIDNAHPKVGPDHTATTGVFDLRPVTYIGTEKNYWNMSTRRTSKHEGGQDGSYTYKITIDKKTQLPTKWEIFYTDLKRVAYILSTEEDASANTLSATRNDIVDPNVDNFGSGKMVGPVYVKSGSKFYAISNAATLSDLGFDNENSKPKYAFPGYEDAIQYTDFNVLPTYPKLFLWGHGDANIEENVGSTNNVKKILPKWGTFVLNVEEGLSNWEFNFNKGNWDLGHLNGGMSGEIQRHGHGTVITSLSMVGPAIPGTMDGEEWNWASKVGDMIFDASENCYKLTLTTSDNEKGKPFRFVGNRNKEINCMKMVPLRMSKLRWNMINLA